MLFNYTTFIGIDPTTGKRPMAYAALDQDLRLLALDEGSLDEIVAFVGGQQSAFVAVNAPRRPHQGLMQRSEVRAGLKPVPRPGRWTGFRVVEYQLRQHNIRVPRTRGKEDDCPVWMQTGFEFHKRLERLGYKDYPAPDTTSQLMEVYPHAAFTALLGCLPFKKTSMEGRLQRQLVLHNRGLEIPDPMRVFEEITRYRLMQGILPLDGLYSVRKLDALVAAYTAWVAATTPKEVILLGNPEEGQIVLPVSELNPKY